MTLLAALLSFPVSLICARRAIPIITAHGLPREEVHPLRGGITVHHMHRRGCCANSAHTKTTAVRRAPRTKTPPPNNEQKVQSGRHNLTRFHETAHNLLSHHVVSSHKTQHPSTHCSGFNATKASCQSPAPPHKTYTLQQVMDTSMALPSEGGVVAVVVAGRTNGHTRMLPL